MSCRSATCCRRHPKACSSVKRRSGQPSGQPRGQPRGLARFAHVTFFSFAGGNDVVREVSRSIFSLSRVCSRPPEVLVLTDMVGIQSRLRTTFQAPWGGPRLTAMQVSVELIQRDWVRHRLASFGLHRLGHHSGWGGYSKMIAADLLPSTLNHTILVDTDSIFGADIAGLWAFLGRLPERQVLAAKRIAKQEGSCLHGQRERPELELRQRPPVAACVERSALTQR